MGVVAWFGAHFVSMVNGVAFGLLLFTLAVGLSLIYGMMNVLNLAHGALYLGGAYLAYLISDGSWLGLGLGLLAGIGAGVLGGGLLTVAVQPLFKRDHNAQAMLTIGMAFIAVDVFMAFSGGASLPAEPPDALRGSISLIGHQYPVYRLMFIGVAAVLAVVVYLLFERSNLGALVRATVADRQMVASLGVDTRKVLLSVFTLGCALAVVGGVLGAPILGPSPGADENVLMLSLVVVVIGGLGSVTGVLIGALVVGEIETLGIALLPQYAAFLLFGAMFVILALRPRGLASLLKGA